MQVRWSPWTWGSRRREVEAIHLHSELVDRRERLFTDRLIQTLHGPVRSMEAMTSALATDDEIVRLRELAEAGARARHSERAIPASVYVDARTELQTARIQRIRHRIELERSRAHYLTTLGVEIR